MTFLLRLVRPTNLMSRMNGKKNNNKEILFYIYTRYCSTETNKTRFYHPAKHVVTDACRFGKQLCSPRETYMYYFCTTECTAYSVFMKNLHLQGKNCPNIYLAGTLAVAYCRATYYYTDGSLKEQVNAVPCVLVSPLTRDKYYCSPVRL